MRIFLIGATILTGVIFGCNVSNEVKKEPSENVETPYGIERPVAGGNIIVEDTLGDQRMTFYSSARDNVENCETSVNVVNASYDQGNFFFKPSYEKLSNLAEDYLELRNSEGQSLRFYINWKKTLVKVDSQQFIIFISMIVDIDGQKTYEAYLVPYSGAVPKNSKAYLSLYEKISHSRYQETGSFLF